MINAAYWLFAIEASLIPGMTHFAEGRNIVRYIDKPLSSVTFEAEVGTTVGPVNVFLGGSTRSTQLHTGGINFSPMLQRYDIGAGLSIGSIEIGARHFCEHPVLPNGRPLWAPIDLARREIYARVEFGGKN